MAFKVPKPGQDQQDLGEYSKLAGGSGPALGTAPVSGVAQPVEMPYAPKAQEPGGGTGFVNFDQYYNANASAAQAGAKRLATGAQAQAQTARTGMQKAYGDFQNQARTGTLQGPTAQQQAWGKYSAPAAPKKVVKAAYFTPDGQGDSSTITEGQEGLISEKPKPAAGRAALEEQNAGVPQYTGETAAEDEAAVRAGAAGKYTGPNSLADLEAYKGLASDTGKADELLGGLQNDSGIGAQLGGNRFDAALVGAAGRPKFAELGQQYGSLRGQLSDAVKASQGVAASAKQQSDDAAAAYQALIDGKPGEQATPGDNSEAIITNARQNAIDAQTYGEDIKAGTIKQGEDGSLLWGDKPAPSNTSGDTTLADHVARSLGAKGTIDELKNPKSVAQRENLARTVGATAAEVDFVLNSMTPEDFAAYQKAAAEGPTALRKWFRAILARKK